MDDKGNMEGSRIRRMGPEDPAKVLAAGVFDFPAIAQETGQFLGRIGAAHARNFLIVAVCKGRIGWFASGRVLDQPDKPRNLCIQGVGVSERGRKLGCEGTWALTEAGNSPARAL